MVSLESIGAPNQQFIVCLRSVTMPQPLSLELVDCLAKLRSGISGWDKKKIAWWYIYVENWTLTAQFIIIHFLYSTRINPMVIFLSLQDVQFEKRPGWTRAMLKRVSKSYKAWHFWICGSLTTQMTGPRRSHSDRLSFKLICMGRRHDSC